MSKTPAKAATKMTTTIPSFALRLGDKIGLVICASIGLDVVTIVNVIGGVIDGVDVQDAVVVDVEVAVVVDDVMVAVQFAAGNTGAWVGNATDTFVAFVAVFVVVVIIVAVVVAAVVAGVDIIEVVVVLLVVLLVVLPVVRVEVVVTGIT